MILSNEPGCYRPGEFGVRIENLVAVESVPHSRGGGDGAFLRFRRLTQVPIDRRCIDLSLLREGDVDWVDNYHEEVFSTALNPSPP